MSAADAPGPNDMIAKLNAAPTQTKAHFSKVMTFAPLPLLLDPSLRGPVRRQKDACHARHAPRVTPKPDTGNVGDGSTQSSPDCALLSRKRYANRGRSRKDSTAVTKLSQQEKKPSDFITLECADNLGGASRTSTATSRMTQI
jgi:hypothetical protein